MVKSKPPVLVAGSAGALLFHIPLFFLNQILLTEESSATQMVSPAMAALGNVVNPAFALSVSKYVPPSEVAPALVGLEVPVKAVRDSELFAKPTRIENPKVLITIS